tara:strand:+ start:1992 stop:2147 length:156 start_codon:yes stop_codon:yes gene_type:complete
MREITINVGDEDIKDLQEIFKNEANFEPQVKQDRVIVAILKEVLTKAQQSE